MRIYAGRGEWVSLGWRSGASVWFHSRPRARSVGPTWCRRDQRSNLKENDTYTYRVTHKGKSVVVRMKDSGGFAKYGRIIDLSRGAARKLGLEQAGVGKVCVERL